MTLLDERTPAPPATGGGPDTATRRRALLAAAVGNFVEWYDFVLYGASAWILAQVFFPQQDATAALLATFATFGVAFLARPFGAVILGHVADRAGRRNVLAVSVISMSVGTALIAVLPTYADAGLAAPLMLLALRALQGFMAGGEYGGSATFMVEYAPRGQRGRYGAWQTATIGLGSAAATVAVLVATSTLAPQDLMAWGWRVPFALALPLGLAGLVLRLRLAETPNFRSDRARRAAPARMPAVETLRVHPRLVVTGAAVVSGATLSMYVFQNWVPTHLASAKQVPLATALSGNLVGIAAFAAGSVACGVLADRYGRRPLLIAGAVALLVLVLPAFALSSQGTFTSIAVGQSLFGLAVAPIMGVVPALLSEMFPTSIRVSGLSIAYTLANALLGGTAPLVVVWLVAQTGTDLSAVWYCLGAVALSLAGALAVRETAWEELKA